MSTIMLIDKCLQMKMSLLPVRYIDILFSFHRGYQTSPDSLVENGLTSFKVIKVFLSFSPFGEGMTFHLRKT